MLWPFTQQADWPIIEIPLAHLAFIARLATQIGPVKIGHRFDPCTRLATNSCAMGYVRGGWLGPDTYGTARLCDLRKFDAGGIGSRGVAATRPIIIDCSWPFVRARRRTYVASSNFPTIAGRRDSELFNSSMG